MSTLAWFGAGLLGSGFVEAALSRGDAVRVYNRSRSKAEALGARGAFVAATPAEALDGAERVHLCLSDDASVEQVLEALAPSLAAGSTVIDHTTVSPSGARDRAQRLAARGIGMLACPVFMGPPNARNATGRMLCAGPSALVERFAPALRAMTGELVLLGEDVGRPCAFKLVGNAMIIGVAGCLADSFALGEGAGLSVEEVQTFVAGFPFAGIVAGRGARMIKGDYAASFELSMARKDVRLMVEASGARPLAVLPGLGARMDELVAKGYGADDLGALSAETIPKKP
jgi:3-hydroxyisobutyrate dehydrogenase-like beta-hydroxyacid dehydrogenase